jgi:hypothetical protein
MIDYTIFYKTPLDPKSDWPKDHEWDLFISAFNSSKRVHDVFNQARSKEKHWLIFPEYKYKTCEYPPQRHFATNADSEADFILQFLSQINGQINNRRICIDLTGFIRPYQMVLTKILAEKGVKQFDALYSEPTVYAQREKTHFSSGSKCAVRQVAGFEGSHSTDTSNDLLIIGAGYDIELISQVAHHKEGAKKVQLLGLPSLRADMYQENVLQADGAQESLGPANTFFSPANDPFVTASVLSKIAAEYEKRVPITNLYLSPLASKAQVLGFWLFYHFEGNERPTSILFPFKPEYSRETSKGIARIWKYTIETGSRSSNNYSRSVPSRGVARKP